MRKKAIFLMMSLALASTTAMIDKEAANTTIVYKEIKTKPQVGGINLRRNIREKTCTNRGC